MRRMAARKKTVGVDEAPIRLVCFDRDQPIPAHVLRAVLPGAHAALVAAYRDLAEAIRERDAARRALARARRKA
jgi:hypothetical protein